MERIIVTAECGATRGQLRCGTLAVACRLGAGGVTASKTEGDGCTPAGIWPLRRVLYRADRISRPRTGLPLAPIDRAMGWSDDPADPAAYNRLVTLPYPFSHEVLWRDDGLYDIVVELGYNDDPPIPGRGSAIFLHVADPAGAATAGCVAVSRNVLRQLLAPAGPGAMIEIIAVPAQR